MNGFWKLRYANDVDALIPELWANESLAILQENMVAANLVHRDFSPLVANFGDVVNTRKPGEFKAKRKTNADSVTIQDVASTNIPVKLNQHIHTSFIIKDGEEALAFKDLVQVYLEPSMIAQARFIDQIVLGQAFRFRNTFGGSLGTPVTEAALIELRKAFEDNKAPRPNRNLLVTSATEADMLKIQNFVQAYAVGDDGTALAEAALTRKYGFNIFMSQNTSYVATGNTKVIGAINNSGGYGVGTTALTVDGLSAAISNGTWLTIGGDATPLQVASTTGSGTPTVITLVAPGLRRAVANDAVITIYTPGEVDNASGYAVGYAKEIVVDDFSVAPQIGQSVSFGTATDMYTIIDVTGLTGITLDRPLDAALADEDKVNIAPPGSYNFAFQRNALALVSRPLPMPRPGAGALSAVRSVNGMGMRVVITYDGDKQGHLVTLDVLAGIAILESKQGGVLLG